MSDKNDSEIIYEEFTDFKTIADIPILSVTDIKKTPMLGFETAEENETGVYITNRNEIVGVMLSRSQYEALVGELEQARKVLRDIIH